MSDDVREALDDVVRAWHRIRAVLDVELPVDHCPGGPNGEYACPEIEGGECECGAQARNLAAGKAMADMEEALRVLRRSPDAAGGTGTGGEGP